MRLGEQPIVNSQENLFQRPDLNKKRSVREYIAQHQDETAVHNRHKKPEVKAQLRTKRDELI